MATLYTQQSDKIKNPLESCLNVLKKDKNLFFLSFLKIFLILVVSIIFILLFANKIDFKQVISQGGKIETIISNNYQNFLSIIIYFVIVYFLDAYFNSLTSWIAFKVVKEEKTSISESITRVNKFFGQVSIFISINILLKVATIFIRNKVSGKENNVSVGETIFSGIFSIIGGLVWRFASFFIVPIIVIEGVSFQEALKKSANVFKSTWGENVISSLSIAFLVIPGVLLFGGFWWLGNHYFSNEILGDVLFWGGACFLLISFILSSTLKAILKVILYTYAATGLIYKGFLKNQMEDIFKLKPVTQN